MSSSVRLIKAYIMLGAEFFARDTLEVARDLIGVALVVGECEGIIVETEAYKMDEASHAVTRRNKANIMRETFGHVYVYMIYGVHFCLNFTTERGQAGAVLIRALEPTCGIEVMMRRRGTSNLLKLASGPGRLCQALGIDLSFNGEPVGERIKLCGRARNPRISSGRRVGISRATELEWRFFDAESRFVSRR